jgi:hypothetical protein
MSRKDEFSTPILNSVKRLGRATRDQILDDGSHGIKKQQVDNAIKTLVRRGAIQNISATPRPAIYTADMTVKTSPRAKQVRKLKSDDPVPEKYVGIIAPGIMINKMAGVYVPTRTQPMRPGAMDHEACQSLRTDGLKPYTGQFLTLGVKAK